MMATARKLPSGSYRVRVYLGKDSTGKLIYKSITAPTKKEAERLAANYTFSPSGSLTVHDAVQRFIAAKDATLSANTIRSYVSMSSRFAPIASVPLDRLTSEKLQAFVSSLVSDGLSPKTVRNVYGLLTSTLRMFRPGSHFSVTLPQKIPSRTLVPSDAEVALMIQAAGNDDLRLAIQLAAFGSLRRGEVCALLSDCVFDDHIEIRRTCARRSGGTWYIKDSPKTAAGFRSVPLPPSIMADLRQRAAASPGPHKVIRYQVSGLFDAFRRLLVRLDLPPYHFHSLRHYFASFCHAQGIPDRYIMQIGGWDDIGTLLKIYQHTMPEKMEDVIATINRHFDRVSSDYMPQNMP